MAGLASSTRTISGKTASGTGRGDISKPRLHLGATVRVGSSELLGIRGEHEAMLDWEKSKT